MEVLSTVTPTDAEGECLYVMMYGPCHVEQIDMINNSPAHVDVRIYRRDGGVRVPTQMLSARLTPGVIIAWHVPEILRGLTEQGTFLVRSDRPNAVTFQAMGTLALTPETLPLADETTEPRIQGGPIQGSSGRVLANSGEPIAEVTNWRLDPNVPGDESIAPVPANPDAIIDGPGFTLFGMPVIFTTDIGDDVIEVGCFELEEGPPTCLVQFRGIVTVQGLMEAAGDGRSWCRAERMRRERDPDRIGIRIHPSRREAIILYSRSEGPRVLQARSSAGPNMPEAGGSIRFRASELTQEQREQVARSIRESYRGVGRPEPVFLDPLDIARALGGGDQPPKPPKIEGSPKRRILLQEEEADG